MGKGRCFCNSGQPTEAQFDGYGIFLCYTCERCHVMTMQRYRRDIMERYDACEQIEPDE
jgi:hypothetical protein